MFCTRAFNGRRGTWGGALSAAGSLLVVLLALAPSTASAARNSPEVASVAYPGMQKLHYEYGPIKIEPGQNTIEVKLNTLKPKVPGYITRFEPNLVYAKDHSIPRVDVVHLHHGVWLARGYPTFAAGEEKTIFQQPRGYGYKYDPSDQWLMNYMIHNLTPTQTSVYITYDIDFVPTSTPAAADITEVKPLWMDVAGIRPYPVFDALRKWGKNGKFTFPDDAATPAEKAKIGGMASWRARSDMTLISTAGHLHPGGLWTDLNATREGTKINLFRSKAEYYEPAGAVSWDVAMTGTKPTWRPVLHAGDKLSVSATYDTSKASWYESMGIMPVFYADGVQPGSKDPFLQGVDTSGVVTHGHLKENDNHGGTETILPNAKTLLGKPMSKTTTGTVSIKDFLYGAGDLTSGDDSTLVPTVPKGGTLRFVNLDDKNTIWHTITACKAPCNKETGIAYPLADGSVDFDSGELGTDPTRQGFTASSGLTKWEIPKNLAEGTYTYFCRIHPFMRGAFRVQDKAAAAKRAAARKALARAKQSSV